VTAIARFDGEYRFLSNFYPSEIYYEGLKWPTVEHAYQAAKTLDLPSKQRIREAETAGEAKRLGQLVPLVSDWHNQRMPVMRDLLKLKFCAWRTDDLTDEATTFAFNQLSYSLMETFPLDLIEGNHWHDTYFGVCYGSKKCECPSEGNGQNWLGRLLVNRREQLMKYRDDTK
jgi:ribA/ribD-fused uncharacterized protein